MLSPLVFLALLVLVLNSVLLYLLLKRSTKVQSNPQTEQQLTQLEKNLERTERLLKDELTQQRQEAGINARNLREEASLTHKNLTDSLLGRITELSTLQKDQQSVVLKQLTDMLSSNETRLEKLRQVVDERLQHLQQDNSAKLEQMRATVDEKLHATLEKRLGDSFKLVSERLELVHKGLGEMQNLAAGVGDLKKVLTNVKTRGMWGEIQLGNLLEQLFTPDQYESNVCTKRGSNDRVEFAIKMPGKDADPHKFIYLPIDAKFPQEDYQRLLEAQEQANAPAAAEAAKQLEQRIKLEAKTIREKYLDPPQTTDFGILFLPTEGLFAEVLRRPGLTEMLLRDYRVVLSGPTTLAALLSSLQMGFRTLAIEKRSSEVWALLANIKVEFGRFGELLDKTQKKLQEASNSIEIAAQKSRSIEKRLHKVQELPAGETLPLLAISIETE